MAQAKLEGQQAQATREQGKTEGLLRRVEEKAKRKQ